MAGFNPNLWPTFQQSMPMLQGYQAGLGMQMGRQKNQSQPQLDEATLAQMQAQTQGQQLQNQYFPDELKLKQYLADIAMRNATERGNYNNLQMQKLPIFQGNLAARMASTPGGASLLGSNEGVMQNYLAGQAGVTGDFAGNYQPQDDGMMQQPMLSDADIAQAQDATTSKLIKNTTPTRVQTQRYYAKTFDNFADQISDIMPVISQYAGLGGQAKLAKDKAAALTGKVNPDYEKYISFTTYLAPQASNELMQYLGMNHTDSQVKQMMETINPSLLSTNPKLYMQRWNDLVKYSQSIEPTINQSLAQVSGQSPLAAQTGQPTAQPQTSRTPSTVSTVPLGSIEMIDPQGNSRAVPATAREQALAAGWRLG
jgi:hypothetical protein